MKIAIDVFGGDHAPDEIINGSVLALENDPDLELELYGDQNIIRKKLLDMQPAADRIRIVHAPDIITVGESPTTSVKQKLESSLVKGLKAHASGEADAFVSAGSTGAVLAGAVLYVKRIKGIKRPALAPVFPTAGEKGVLLIDCGANVDCKVPHLVHFALMGSAYMKCVMNIQSPRVGLINNGAEEEKGNDLTKETYLALKKTPVNFVGNIEGRDILEEHADVLVCDGFIGNIVTKFLEGCANMIFSMLKNELSSDLIAKTGAALAMPALKRMKGKLDYKEYGGAPFLGVNGVVRKAHGSSDARAFAAAIRQAKHFSQYGVNDQIRKLLEETEA